MRGSRDSRGGPGPSNIIKKALTFFPSFFLVLNLFYRSPMVYFKENYIFSRFERGFKIFFFFFFFFGGGGVQLFPRGSNCLFPIETLITCDFPGESRHPVPSSGSAHVSMPAISHEPAIPPIPSLIL